MVNKIGNKCYLIIVLLGGDYFLCQGIVVVLKNMVFEMQVIVLSDDYLLMEIVFLIIFVDVIFLFGMEKYYVGFDCLKYIKNIKFCQFDVFICMYFVLVNFWLWICGDIDVYILLQELFYYW